MRSKNKGTASKTKCLRSCWIGRNVDNLSHVPTSYQLDKNKMNWHEFWFSPIVAHVPPQVVDILGLELEPGEQIEVQLSTVGKKYSSIKKK